MNKSTFSKEIIFLRILDDQIMRIDRLVNECDPSAIDSIQSTIGVMNEWKEKGNIKQDSVGKLSDRLLSSLDRYKNDCPLEWMR